MCRLFGLHAGKPVSATFWLLDAPDSLAQQSHKNPDGTGIGVFEPSGAPMVSKQPVAAWTDPEFTREAVEYTGTTFITHVRYATTGAPDAVNTHPFLQDGRLFAHNGQVEGLDAMDARLDELSARDLVRGKTDSERVFALITASVRRHGGDVGAGLVEAMTWIAGNVPLHAVNILLCTATDMWALRYPDTHDLFILDRRRPAEHAEFELRSNRIHARSEHLMDSPSVVFATETMDGDPAWRLLEPGELVHVGPDLEISSVADAIPEPRHHLTLAELNPAAAVSQSVR